MQATCHFLLPAGHLSTLTGVCFHVPRVQEMIRKVEQQQRQEQLADVTAQLMLLSAVRKVAAAERLGLDLCSREQEATEAAAVFSVLDDVVSWVERPANLAPPQPSRQARSEADAICTSGSTLPLQRPPALKPHDSLHAHQPAEASGAADLQRPWRWGASCRPWCRLWWSATRRGSGSSSSAPPCLWQP